MGAPCIQKESDAANSQKYCFIRICLKTHPEVDNCAPMTNIPSDCFNELIELEDRKQ